LNAGTGFKAYRWQDGSTDSLFIAPGPGQYDVTVTDYCDYKWKDTINITRGNDVAFDMGPDRMLCPHDTLALEAPTGFSQYRWLPVYNIRISAGVGQSAEVWPAVDTGYMVTAWTADGCMVMDTVQVGLLPLPPVNLGNDTGICVGQTLLLQVPAGLTYLWSNGATTATYTVATPGVYWVQVTDANGCNTTDSIVVSRSKKCKQRIYFPNGFTPDNNGHNDVWRPVVLGDADYYRLTIYNRFGEKVFETSDPLQGWDGRFRGTAQPGGGFVWVCSYRFSGEAAQTERGSFLLLR
jgi:gliding motility-associated-like protein